MSKVIKSTMKKWSVTIEPLTNMTNIVKCGTWVESGNGFVSVYADRKLIKNHIPNGKDVFKKLKIDMRNEKDSFTIRLYGLFGIDDTDILKVKMNMMNYYVAGLLDAYDEFSIHSETPYVDVKDAIAYCELIKEFYVETLALIEPVATIIRTEINNIQEHVSEFREEYIKDTPSNIRRKAKIKIKLESDIVRSQKKYNAYLTDLNSTIDTLQEYQKEKVYEVGKEEERPAIPDWNAEDRRPVLVTITGGVAEIEFNPTNANVVIVDVDNGDIPIDASIVDVDNGDIPIDVIITIRGGVAYETYVAEYIELSMEDRDNEGGEK